MASKIEEALSAEWPESDGRAGELPTISYALLLRSLLRHSATDKSLALQEKLVAVAWLPHVTLYATAKGEAAADCPSPGPIIARIHPRDFQRAVDQLWRKSLAHAAAEHLAETAPVFSSKNLPLAHGAIGLLGIALALSVCVLLPLKIISDVIGLAFFVFFLLVTWLRVIGMTEAPPLMRDPPEMDDAALPVYTVLVPLFRETAVLPQILGALSALSYPRDKLDVKLILEETDTVMVQAVRQLILPTWVEILVVPAGKPQTKPRALNFALQYARGSLLTIYDAEDIPDRLQLRAAAKRFDSASPTLGCLQAKLAFYNNNENWLTRQFTIEYAVLFNLLLPSLAKLGWPLPLGGTSNHFRTSILRAVGGWDPYNVTEDADLGMRLARLGCSTETLGSITTEEASSTFRNWRRQRSRWLKGFLVTWLVHMRRPVRLWQELGLGGTLVLHSGLLAVFLSAILFPVFSIAMIAKLSLYGLAPAHSLLVTDGLFLALPTVSWLVMIAAGHKALRASGIRGWWPSLLSMPIYWLLIGLAGFSATKDFFVSRSSWNKTQHGLSRFMQNKRA